MKVAPAVKFEVDKVFDQAERVEALLRDEQPPAGRWPRRTRRCALGHDERRGRRDDD